ncbi:MAG: hydrogenase nickel incorporation protein HypB [Anaerolineae bacterium]|uniref:hydrogenase nickel incorporation protein HypB n=2 Tax=Thermoflexus sp. TaxID=1969742 RepID=UPI0025CBE62D|nr:hydrogenase nickel incorporation protein HypB [Thermoflexus sp.]MCS7350452.1 hydrogenase nickel incorporation protein HypB [Thermoflexus sp.]MDW8179903.1 hydrogenase nickel incorporation protein HypB [Anaerolineae bacterium]
MRMSIPVVKAILQANEAVASENRAAFDAADLLAVNLMSSPGAGKTSLILATIERLPASLRAGVIEGDIASTLDAERIAAHGIPVVQINTGGACHLDAPMIRSALPHLPLETLDVLFIENVGNLVCPAEFDLGAHLNIVIASVPEGHDKPYKYPGMFQKADGIVLNKADLMDVLEFDLEAFQHGVEILRPDVPLFIVSCRTGHGLEAWTEWLFEQHRLRRKRYER